MILNAKNQFPDPEFHTMNAEKIELSEKFDVIILSNLIGYLDDIQRVLEEIQKVCHPQTKIIITYYNFLWEPLLKFGEWIGYKTKTPNQNWLSLSEIDNLLFLSGFQVYRNSKRMLLPVYIPVLSEILNGFLAKFPLFRSLNINNFTFAKPAAQAVKKDFRPPLLSRPAMKVAILKMPWPASLTWEVTLN